MELLELQLFDPAFQPSTTTSRRPFLSTAGLLPWGTAAAYANMHSHFQATGRRLRVQHLTPLESHEPQITPLEWAHFRYSFAPVGWRLCKRFPGCCATTQCNGMRDGYERPDILTPVAGGRHIPVL